MRHVYIRACGGLTAFFATAIAAGCAHTPAQTSAEGAGRITLGVRGAQTSQATPPPDLDTLYRLEFPDLLPNVNVEYSFEGPSLRSDQVAANVRASLVNLFAEYRKTATGERILSSLDRLGGGIGQTEVVLSLRFGYDVWIGSAEYAIGRSATGTTQLYLTAYVQLGTSHLPGTSSSSGLTALHELDHLKYLGEGFEKYARGKDLNAFTLDQILRDYELFMAPDFKLLPGLQGDYAGFTPIELSAVSAENAFIREQSAAGRQPGGTLRDYYGPPDTFYRVDLFEGKTEPPPPFSPDEVPNLLALHGTPLPLQFPIGPHFKILEGVQLPEFDPSFLHLIFEQPGEFVPGGVEFSSFSFSGLQFRTGAQVGLDVRPVAGRGVNLATATEKLDRFSRLFREALILPRSAMSVSLELTGAALDPRLQVSELGRIMLDRDIDMKRDFLNATLTANGAVNQGAVAQWITRLKTETPDIWTELNNRPNSFVPAPNISIRATIIGDTVQIEQSNRVQSIRSCPLSLNYIIRDASLDLSQSGLSPAQQTRLLALRDSWETWLRQRLDQSRDAFIQTLNESPGYEDLRDAYCAIAHADLYRQLAAAGSIQDSDIYRPYLDLGALPPVLQRPFNAAFYAAQANGAFAVTEQISFPEIIPTSLQYTGGVTMDFSNTTSRVSAGRPDLRVGMAVRECDASPSAALPSAPPSCTTVPVTRPDQAFVTEANPIEIVLRVENFGNAPAVGYPLAIRVECGNRGTTSLDTSFDVTIPEPLRTESGLSAYHHEVPFTWTPPAPALPGDRWTLCAIRASVRAPKDQNETNNHIAVTIIQP